MEFNVHQGFFVLFVFLSFIRVIRVIRGETPYLVFTVIDDLRDFGA